MRTDGPVLAGTVARSLPLTGCNPLDVTGPSNTVTPAAVETDEPAVTPAPDIAPRSPGGGIGAAPAPVDAHAGPLRNESRTRRRSVVGRAPDGLVGGRERAVARFAADRDGYHVTANRTGGTAGGPMAASPERFAGGERVVERTLPRTEPTRRTRFGPDDRPAGPRRVRLSASVDRDRPCAPFGAVEAARVGPVDRATKDTHHRVTGTAPATTTGAPPRYRNVTDAAFTAVVDARGPVRSDRIADTARSIEHHRRVGVEADGRYTAVGATTVEGSVRDGEAVAATNGTGTAVSGSATADRLTRADEPPSGRGRP